MMSTSGFSLVTLGSAALDDLSGCVGPVWHPKDRRNPSAAHWNRRTCRHNKTPSAAIRASEKRGK